MEFPSDLIGLRTLEREAVALRDYYTRIAKQDASRHLLKMEPWENALFIRAEVRKYRDNSSRKVPGFRDWAIGPHSRDINGKIVPVDFLFVRNLLDADAQARYMAECERIKDAWNRVIDSVGFGHSQISTIFRESIAERNDAAKRLAAIVDGLIVRVEGEIAKLQKSPPSAASADLAAASTIDRTDVEILDSLARRPGMAIPINQIKAVNDNVCCRETASNRLKRLESLGFVSRTSKGWSIADLGMEKLKPLPAD